MYKILIIDDEELIRKSLSKIITQHLTDCAIVGEADCAIDGIEKINRLNPDIIITDIFMEQMSGLDMIEKARPNSKVIVITGYRDFNYAQQAVSLNVFSLLLKPIKAQELIKTISYAIDCIKKEQKQISETEHLNSILMDNLPYIKQKILLDMIYGISPTDSPNAEQLLESYNLHINKFSLLLIEIFDTTKKNEGNAMHLMQCDILSIFQDLLKQNHDFYHIFLDCERLLIILKNDFNIYTEKALLSASTMLIDKMRIKYNDITVNVALSSPCNGIHDLNAKYIECKQTLYYIRNLDNNIAISFTDVSVLKEDQALHQKFFAYKNSLINALDDCDFQASNYYISQITELVKSIDVKDYKFIHRFYTQILLYINDLREDTHTDVADSELPNRISNIENMVRNCDDINVLNDILVMSTTSILKNIESSNRQKTSEPIKKAIEYISNNYQNNISLEDIAAHIYLSVAHTSRLFKKTTGKSIIDYINELKINKAIKLLNSGNYKINEVSQMVGLTNTHYFSTLFKKYTNKTPSYYTKEKNN